jgi:hypothetical protein
VRENPNGSTDLYGIDQFTYIPEENCYATPIVSRVGVGGTFWATATSEDKLTVKSTSAILKPRK